MSGQDENRKRAMSWTDWGTMSQWADNTDILNQWAESRRQFAGVHACVFFHGGEVRGEVRELMLSGFQGVSCRWWKPVLQVPVDVHELFFNPRHRLKITQVPLSQLDLFSPFLSHTNTHSCPAVLQVLCSYSYHLFFIRLCLSGRRAREKYLFKSGILPCFTLLFLIYV